MPEELSLVGYDDIESADFAIVPLTTIRHPSTTLGASAVRILLGLETEQDMEGEDNGSMSAWQLFSSLGFYPLQVGSPTYAIGSPLYKKATIHLQNGKDLVINAPNNSSNNVYVQGVKVNGKPQSATYFTQDQLAKGGTIDFAMGPKPSTWGTNPKDAPPSITQGSSLPSPLTDATNGNGGVPTSSDSAANAAQLFDNNSSTHVTLVGSTPCLQYELTGPTVRAGMYTLTSSTTADDPAGWILKGSNDGTDWTTLDTRTNEKFTWRTQTRAFTIANPGSYRYYRVKFKSTTGATALAEVELLK
jgi:hypothetical protein